MGLIRRNRSGKYIGGSKLNVPGQGIYTVVRQPNDKESIKSQIERLPRPTPTPSQIIAPECDITLTIILPTPTPTPTVTLTSTPTPTPTVTLTSTPTPTPTVTLTSTPTPTPTITLTPTPTPSSTPIEICYLATEDLIILGAENGDNLLTECI